MLDEQYSYSFDEEGYYGRFATREEAIAEAEAESTPSKKTRRPPMPDELIELKGHTEGPWCPYQNREHEYWGVYDGGDNVCDLYYLEEDTHCHHGYENAEANARLIAAAPSLLAIATRLHRVARDAGVLECWLREVWVDHGITPPPPQEPTL